MCEYKIARPVLYFAGRATEDDDTYNEGGEEVKYEGEKERDEENDPKQDQRRTETQKHMSNNEAGWCIICFPRKDKVNQPDKPVSPFFPLCLVLYLKPK